MADLQSVMGLLYRADWTQLSMSADVRFERGGGHPILKEVPDEEQGGYHSGSATLLIAPGGRYRLEHGDESTGHVEGSDGERGWTWWRPNLAPPPSVQVDVNRAPPLLELFRPSGLLSGFTLEVRGPVTACGRNAIAVTATRRTSVEDSPGLRGNSSDRLKVIVDAELGILLSRGHGRTWIVRRKVRTAPAQTRQRGRTGPARPGSGPGADRPADRGTGPGRSLRRLAGAAGHRAAPAPWVAELLGQAGLTVTARLTQPPGEGVNRPHASFLARKPEQPVT